MEDNKKPDFLQNQAPKEQSDSDKKFFTSYNRKSIHKVMYLVNDQTISAIFI